MSVFWKQYKEYIITISIFFFGILLIWYGIIPIHKMIQSQMNRTQEILTDREIRDELVASLADVREQKNLVEEREHQLDVVIPKSKIVDLVKDIEALAKETDNAIVIDSRDQSIVAVGQSKPKKDSEQASDKDVEKSLIESLPSEHRLLIAIKLTGDYDNIARFIQRLEAMPNATDIVALSLSVQQPKTSVSQSGVNIFSLNMTSVTDTQNQEVLPVPVIEALPLEATLDTVVYVNEDE